MVFLLISSSCLLPSLSRNMVLLHFQVGSEGKKESTLDKLLRFVTSPWLFFVFLLYHRPAIVHLNTSLERKSFWRDLVYLFVAKMLGIKVIIKCMVAPFPRFFPLVMVFLHGC